MIDAAQKLLSQAEELVYVEGAHESLLETLNSAEELLPENVLVLCRSAKVLFRYGMLNQKGRFFLLALDKLKLAEEKNPLFFDTSYEWWQLWGNILVQLGRFVNDSCFFEMALDKYQCAESVTSLPDSGLYWDWGEAWSLLGKKSGEITDLQQALAKFMRAQSGGESASFFRIEYGRTLASYGLLKGDFHPLDEALLLFQGVIADTYYPEEEPSIAYIIAFRELAFCMKHRYMLSHKQEHFQQADTAFREAILATSKNAELWLDWGELYLHAAWLKRDLTLAETGLEKLTSSKIKECDPLRVSVLLGVGLVTFGLFLENLKLIKDGQQRVQAALEVAPECPQLLYASGFALLGEALFFSDERLYEKAASIFKQGIAQDATTVENWHALFQTYLAWGVLLQESSFAQKGVQAIAQLSHMRPCSAHHLNEWGVALLRLRQLELDAERQMECAEEAALRFQNSWELSKESQALYNWGCALDLLGDLTGDEEYYEKAIEILSQVYEQQPNEIHVCYQFGLALSHLGELVRDVEMLQQSAQLLELVAMADQEDEIVWCDFGYVLLNLSELTFDPVLPEKGENSRREAEKKLLRAVELGSGDACYHLACLYSLSELHDASMHYLRKADLADSLPSIEDLEQDEWLENVRKTLAFQEFQMLREKNG